jgi:hypothetical protein
MGITCYKNGSKPSLKWGKCHNMAWLPLTKIGTLKSSNPKKHFNLNGEYL